MTENENKVHEPLFHVVKRNIVGKYTPIKARAIAIVSALIVCSIVSIIVTGVSPFGLFAAMFKSGLGSSFKIISLVQKIAILLCISLAVAPAFKMHFWNTGAEGQVLIGGLATAACMILLGPKLPDAVLIPIMLIAGVAFGALWALIPALAKAQWGTNETLFTLMMNYVAMRLISYFVTLWENPKDSGHIGIIKYGHLPEVGFEYLLNIIIVAIATALMYIYLKSSKHGYELAVVGESENTARYIGIKVKQVVIRTMILSGAVCGLAGFLIVAGTDYTVTPDSAGGQGFTAIMVAWLAKFNPLYMILTAFLIIFLQVGAGGLAVAYKLNHAYADILTGIILFFVIGCEFFINYEIKFRHKKEAKEETK